MPHTLRTRGTAGPSSWGQTLSLLPFAAESDGPRTLMRGVCVYAVSLCSPVVSAPHAMYSFQERQSIGYMK